MSGEITKHENMFIEHTISLFSKEISLLFPVFRLCIISHYGCQNGNLLHDSKWSVVSVRHIIVNNALVSVPMFSQMCFSSSFFTFNICISDDLCDMCPMKLSTYILVTAVNSVHRFIHIQRDWTLTLQVSEHLIHFVVFTSVTRYNYADIIMNYIRFMSMKYGLVIKGVVDSFYSRLDYVYGVQSNLC